MHCRICPECGSEFIPELTEFSGTTELIEKAEAAAEDTYSFQECEATVVLSCRCDSVEVEFRPGRVLGYELPEQWLVREPEPEQ